jgi:PBSX family phage terminase large subunit
VLGYNQEQAFKLFIDADGLGLKNIFAGHCAISHDDHGDHLAITMPDGYGGECIKRIYYKGGGKADSYKAFQGLSFGSVVFLEIDLLHPNTWHEAFRRTFAARKRWHLADLNPPAPQHPVINDVFNAQNTIWEHWTMDDNPILTPERKQAIYEILKKNPYLLKRDWLGERCMPQGVIYASFNHDRNIVSKMVGTPIEMFFAGDGGLSDATSISCNIITKESTQGGFKYRLYRVANYYYDSGETGIVKAMSTQAKEIVYQFMPWCCNRFSMHHSVFKVDPACKALREELRLLGVETDGADNNAHDIKGNTKGLKVGIEYLQSAMEQGLYLLLETDNERYGHYNHLRELSLYVVDRNGEPVDMYNHSLDEARYANNYFYKQYIL